MRAPDDICTFEDARRALGLTEGDLFGWVADGRLRAYRMDPQVRFRATDLDALVERRREARSRKFIPLAEAVELSGVPADTLMQYMVDGAVSAFRADRDVYFRKDEMGLLRMAAGAAARPNGHGTKGRGNGAPAEVTLEEAAARTQLSRWELACLVDAGELPTVSPAAQMVFRRSEVDALSGVRAVAEALAPSGGAADVLQRLTQVVGFRSGPAGTASPDAIRERVRTVARAFGLVADTLEDLVAGLAGTLVETGSGRRDGRGGSA